MFKSRFFWAFLLLLGVFALVTVGSTGNDQQSSQAAKDKGAAKKQVASYVLRTGQTVSYAPGDDGDLQAGAEWPVPRFVDNGDGTVTDQLTLLMWTQDANAIVTVTWAIGVQACNDLVFAGYDDWRMPNIREMESLFDYSANNLPIGHPFVNIGGYKWTSTTRPFNTINDVWLWQMNLDLNSSSKNNLSNVWPVRGPVHAKDKKR